MKRLMKIGMALPFFYFGVWQYGQFKGFSNDFGIAATCAKNQAYWASVDGTLTFSACHDSTK